jgi:hypothetical protein
MGAAQAATQLPPDQLKALSYRWVWEVRALEWLKATRRVQAEAMAPVKDELSALLATRLRAHRAALELECLELEKTLSKARGEIAEGAAALPTQLDPRELAALRRVNVTASDAFRREAEGLPPEGAGEAGPDWSRLPPDKLEEYRKLRALADGGH